MGNEGAGEFDLIWEKAQFAWLKKGKSLRGETGHELHLIDACSGTRYRPCRAPCKLRQAEGGFPPKYPPSQAPGPANASHQDAIVPILHPLTALRCCCGCDID
jgi:hypothetical protein